MGPRRLPMIQLSEWTATFDFRCQQVRCVFPNGEIEFLDFYKLEAQCLIDIFFEREDGRAEYVRYREECIRDGAPTDALDEYQDMFEAYAQEKLSTT